MGWIPSLFGGSFPGRNWILAQQSENPSDRAPGRVDGAATNENPNQFSKGIETVIVNGALAHHRGELLAERGQPFALRAVDSRQGLDELKDLDVDRRLGITLSS